MAQIYCIENLVNGKKYVGKTTYSIEERLKGHIKDSRRKVTEKRPLHNAIRKYGEDKFMIFLLEECNKENENECEMRWISQLNTFKKGYNATLGGEGSTFIDEKRVCECYERLGNIVQCSKEVGHCVDSISTILKRNNISIITSQDVMAKKLSIKVNQYDLDMNYIKTYDSLSDAARDLNKSRNSCCHIVSCCKSKRKTAFGYKWKYV